MAGIPFRLQLLSDVELGGGDYPGEAASFLGEYALRQGGWLNGGPVWVHTEDDRKYIVKAPGNPSNPWNWQGESFMAQWSNHDNGDGTSKNIGAFLFFDGGVVQGYPEDGQWRVWDGSTHVEQPAVRCIDPDKRVAPQPGDDRKQYVTALQQRTPHVTLEDCDQLSAREQTEDFAFLPAHRYHLSQKGFQCVPTTTAMLMAYKGRNDLSDPCVLFNLAHNREIDTPMSVEDTMTETWYALMQNALSTSGIEVSFSGPWSADAAGFQEGWSVLKSRLREGLPTIVDVSGLYTGSHTVLIIGYGEYEGKNVAYVLDSCFASPPEAPVWALEIADFEAIWTGAFYEPPGDFRPHMLC